MSTSRCGNVAERPKFNGFLSVIVPSDLIPQDKVMWAACVNDTHDCVCFPFRDGNQTTCWRIFIRAYGPKERETVIK